MSSSILMASSIGSFACILESNLLESSRKGSLFIHLSPYLCFTIANRADKVAEQTLELRNIIRETSWKLIKCL